MITNATQQLAARAIEAARRVVGDNEDAHQVIVERVAYAATEARTIAELAAAATAIARPGEPGRAAPPPGGAQLIARPGEPGRAAPPPGGAQLIARPGEPGRAAPPPGGAQLIEAAQIAVAELAVSMRNRLEPVARSLGLTAAELAYPADVADQIAAGLEPSRVETLGAAAIANGGRTQWPDDDDHGEIRANVRAFCEREVMPHAARIHHEDELVSDRLIDAMGHAGYFGLSIPERYGGNELGNLAMIVTTEELARGSLAAGGSLITRPEILAKALLAGGTEDQKQHWLPKLASGEIMAAISVTEPDTGSDVASLACRAERATIDGKTGFAITGAKAWCTFAGRADVIALLARTGTAADGARGLTLFIVDKPRFAGYELETTQPHGGTLAGRADGTPGYRGMHSFSLQLDRYFVPDAQVVGGEAGIGRGFALQMAGFAAGRLQTGGRACGVAQAAVEQTAAYVASRKQFGRPIGDFGLTRYQLGRMSARLTAARAITYAAAVAMDQDERAASGVAAMAKLLSCDIAVEVTQLGQVLHGGWGYAEEYPISRLVADAQVLPIFEGVRPILALKVIGRALLKA